MARPLIGLSPPERSPCESHSFLQGPDWLLLNITPKASASDICIRNVGFHIGMNWESFAGFRLGDWVSRRERGYREVWMPPLLLF